VLQFLTKWIELENDRRAVTALEYALIAGIIAATIAGGFTILAGNLSSDFETIGTRL